LCEVPKRSILKNSLSAKAFLEQIKLTQQNWVEAGTNAHLSTITEARHNVSCTVIVKRDEWDEVEEFIFSNQQFFSGISLLPASGDLDYPQAPFSTVLTPSEIVEEYGDASVFASGLVVDGLAAFDGDLWKACDAVFGRGEKIPDNMTEPVQPTKNGYSFKEYNQKLIQYFTIKGDYDNWFEKKDWIRRANQFAERYFAGDVVRMSHCLKHVSLWKTWCDMEREHKEVDWDDVVETDQIFVDVNTLAGAACSGGSCELK
jgi:ribonucleoside-diphosphate reductase alpha chain